MGRHAERVQLVAHARREGVEVGVGVPVGDDADVERPRVRQRAVRALAFRLAVSAAIRSSPRPGSDPPRGSGTAISAIRLPCCGPCTRRRGRNETGT
jgi:hypothetical protein